MIIMLFLLVCLAGISGQTVCAANASGNASLKRTSFKNKYTIYIGKSKQVKVSFRSGVRKSRIIWKSSRPSVAKVQVSKNGRVCRIKALKKGKTIISCYPKGKPGRKLTCMITVKKRVPKIKSLTFADNARVIYVGDKVKNSLTVKPSGAKKSKVTYTSSDPSVARVSAKGVVTGIKAGTARITVKSTDGSKKKASYKVIVRMISFAVSSAKIYIGDTYTNKLKNTINVAGATSIRWSSSDPSVATVDASGKVTGVGKGTAVITAKIQNQAGADVSYLLTVSLRIRKDSTKFIAHRGLSSAAPENTLRAFELAGAAGFWGAETDIRKTSDGHFILLHDATFSRMCGVSKKPENMTLEEIRALRITAGNQYETYKNDLRATVVPTLEEYLEVCKKYNMVPVIEIKMTYQRNTSDDLSMQNMEREDMEELFRITNAKMGSRPYMFIDFDYETLLVMQNVLPIENRPNITLQYISNSYDSKMHSVCELNGFEYDLKHTGITRTAVRNLRAQGSKVNLWTVDDRDQVENYIIDGIDYITTNKRFW